VLPGIHTLNICGYLTIQLTVRLEDDYLHLPGLAIMIYYDCVTSKVRVRLLVLFGPMIRIGLQSSDPLLPPHVYEIIVSQ
jgi:hypothetical protein